MKALNRVHLNGLRAAEAAGRLGSLPAAAAELGVTVGAVSQHVLKLERQMGRTLFERSGRGLVPTPGAAEMLSRLTRGMAELETAVARGFRTETDRLTLSVAPVFANRWLVPRLARFGRLRPAVRLRLEATSRLADLDADDVDLAIRRGPGRWSGVEARLLLSQDVYPVVAPALAGGLRRPEDLSRVPIIRDTLSTLSWSLWMGHFGLDEAILSDGSSFNDASLCLDAAIAGQGAMLAWDALAADALADGRLVAPFGHRAETGHGYWLLRSSSRHPTPAMRAFADWLDDEMATRPSLAC